MAFDMSGLLYALDPGADDGDALLTLDKYSGDTLSTVPVSVDLGLAAMEFLPCGRAIVSGYSWDAPNMLYTLDVSTGLLTEIGPTGVDPGLIGLAWIPEPASLLLLGVGALFLPRRNPRATPGRRHRTPRVGREQGHSGCISKGRVAAGMYSIAVVVSLFSTISVPHLASGDECGNGMGCGEAGDGRTEEEAETGLGAPETVLFRAVLHGDFVAVGESTRIWRAEYDDSPQTDPLELAIQGIPDGATVVWAYANWSYETYHLESPTLSQITINGTPVNGSLTGYATPDLKWAWRRDYAEYDFTAAFGEGENVTDIVIGAGGNGTYMIGGAVDDPVAEALGEGISLLVVYEKADEPLREIKVYTGLTSNRASSEDYYTTANLDLEGDPYIGGPVHLFINTLDGQDSPDEWFINGIAADGFPGTAPIVNPKLPDTWQGLLRPGEGEDLLDPPDLKNFMYDHADGDASGFMQPGDHFIAIRSGLEEGNDWIGHSFAAVSYVSLDWCDDGRRGRSLTATITTCPTSVIFTMERARTATATGFRMNVILRTRPVTTVNARRTACRMNVRLVSAR